MLSGLPALESDYTPVALNNCQSRHLPDVATQAGMGDAFPPGLERSSDARAHQDTARWSDWDRGRLDQHLAIRSAKTGPAGLAR